jgi:serine phosphatase RsbU (regulator of sigma subunit)
VASPGETASGDIHVVREFPGGVLVAVVDALGHGQEAMQTARHAAATLEQFAHESPGDLLHRCDRALIGTRGAVMNLASINWAGHVMTWIGVGDVAGVLHAAAHPTRDGQTVLPTRGGIVGTGDLPIVRPWSVPLAPDDTLIFATDGVIPEFTWEGHAQLAPQQIADAILRQFQKGNDDALVLVARYPADEPTPGAASSTTQPAPR